MFLNPPVSPSERLADLRPGDRLGRYVVGDEIGRGGMGIVYRGHDPGLDRAVALKVLPAGRSADADAVARLRAEARAASALDHPHVCTVYEVGEDGEEPARVFVAMALYDGEPLDARLARGPLSVVEAVDVARQVALGLGAAHRKGIVHRDVKPSNIFLTTERSDVGGPCVKLLDFGVAHVEGAPLTRPGTTLGTIEYAAPEQAHGITGSAADQWGLGVTLYEMLAGRRPFEEAYEAALLYAVLNLDPAPLGTLRPDVPEAVGEVVGRLLAKRPEDRYVAAEEAAAALLSAVGAPATAAASSADARGWSGLWRPAWRRWALAAVAALATGAAGFVLLRHLPQEKHVAVLPFTVVGGGVEARAFSDGLVETLTSGLTQLEQYQGELWVVPASEVRAHGVASPSEARRRFGATLIVTGAVQRGGGRVRVPLTLIDAGSLRQLRSATVEVSEARLNTLTAVVSAALEGLLDLELRPEARAGPAPGGTASPEAYDALTQGVGLLDRYANAANVTQATALLERATALDPGYALAYARLGEAYTLRFLSSHDERWLVRAEAAAREALGRAPEMAAAHVLLSKVARLRGDTAQALACARQAATLDAASDDAAAALAAAHDAAGDADQAEQAFLRVVRRKPGYWGGHNRLGLFYYRHGRYAEAEEHFRMAVRVAPDNSEALLNLGSVLLVQEHTDEARSLFERSIRAHPNAEAFSNLGFIAIEAGRFAEAAQAFERSLRLGPTAVVVWGNLAEAYSRLGRLADRRRAYEQGVGQARAQLAVNDRDPLILAALADYYVELGHPQEAREAADRAAGLDPSVDDQVVLASVYARLQMERPARRWLRQALAEGYGRDWAAKDSVLAPLLPKQ